jgi:hypothetical protein
MLGEKALVGILGEFRGQIPLPEHDTVGLPHAEEVSHEFRRSRCRPPSTAGP